MNPKLLLLTLLLALTLTACAPARSEPESGSEVSAPSSQAEEQPSKTSSSVQESSAPESQQPRTLPDWADESFYIAVEDWAGGTRITRLFQVTKENTSTDTTRTISRKLVPHRGWNRVYFFTFSGVSSSPAS